MSKVLNIVCANPICKIGTDKKCVEGFDELEQCPYYGKTQILEEEKEELAEAEIDGSTIEKEQEAVLDDGVDLLKLASGNWLPIATATEVCQRNKTLVLALIGPVDSGKTSLIASVYQLIADAKLENRFFAKSATLVEFEKTAHETRGSSGRKKAAMPRTPHNTMHRGVGFYHICLKNAETGEFTDLLLADRTGEDYKNASSDSNQFLNFPELKRADCISLLIDGDKISNNAQRHRITTESEQFMQALCDSQCLPAKPHLCLVLTKLDKIEQKGDDVKSKAITEFRRLVSTIETRYKSYFSKIIDCTVAASPDESSILPYGTGVPELLDCWFKSKIAIARFGETQHTRSRAIERFAFDARGKENVE